MLNQVPESVRSTNPEYVLLFKNLHFYYDEKMLTVGINSESNLIIQIPIWIHPYTQGPLSLFKIETTYVPIVYKNTKAYSYTLVTPSKPYIAMASENYIYLSN